MFHAEEGHRVAAQELIALHIDLRVRRMAPFPDDVSERLQAVVRARVGRPLPNGVGRRIMPDAESEHERATTLICDSDRRAGMPMRGAIGRSRFRPRRLCCW